MSLQSIQAISSSSLTPNQSIQNTQKSTNTSFSDVLKHAISDVNQSQVQSENLVQQLANGESVNLEQVMVAAQKANITLQTAVEFRNKVVEAYQEIARMQV